MTYHDLPRALLAHLGFTAVSVFFGFVLGVAFGILLSRRPRLSGVVLPVFGMAAFQLVSVVYRRAVHNELTLAGLLFAGGALSALLLALFHADGAVFSVAAAALLTGCMHGVNLMLICMLPPYYAGYGRISLVSGMFNACTYIGSAASAYGMAAFSESFGLSLIHIFSVRWMCSVSSRCRSSSLKSSCVTRWK